MVLWQMTNFQQEWKPEEWAPTTVGPMPSGPPSAQTAAQWLTSGIEVNWPTHFQDVVVRGEPSSPPVALDDPPPTQVGAVPTILFLKKSTLTLLPRNTPRHVSTLLLSTAQPKTRPLHQQRRQ